MCIRDSGCGGQNKNMTMVTMLIKWMAVAPPQIKQVELIFPVVGHSFMPPDRIFGNIEKCVKKIDTVVQPVTYFDIFERFCTVINLSLIHICV